MAGDRFPLATHKKAACSALAYAKRALCSKKYDLIVLDEVNCALKCKLLSTTAVESLVRKKPSALYLVLTGRGAPRKLYRYADCISEVKEIKHHFHAGVPAQKGIEC